MKRLVSVSCLLAVLPLFSMGCGGHEGGVIDTSENPYEVTAAEQARMNAANQAPEELVNADKEQNGGGPQAADASDAVVETNPTADGTEDFNGDNGISYDPQ